MLYYNDIKEMVGNTPMLKLNNFNARENVGIFAKLENFNPGGSIKDRVGVHMIESAENKGILKKGYTIVEATAGNTGLGIALGALNKGYRVIFVVPMKFSVEKQILMKALGAEIVNTPEEDGMIGAVKKTGDLLESIPNSISLRQFENGDNPETHYLTTGPEIYLDMEGKIDYLVAGADPEGSVLGGGREDNYSIEGIGNDFIPGTMDMSLVDRVIKVNDEEAFDMVRKLARKEGLIVGSSSGAAMSAALKLSRIIDGGNIVVIFPDRGDRYFSKNIYN